MTPRAHKTRLSSPGFPCFAQGPAHEGSPGGGNAWIGCFRGPWPTLHCFVFLGIAHVVAMAPAAIGSTLPSRSQEMLLSPNPEKRSAYKWTSSRQHAGPNARSHLENNLPQNRLSQNRHP